MLCVVFLPSRCLQVKTQDNGKTLLNEISIKIKKLFECHNSKFNAENFRKNMGLRGKIAHSMSLCHGNVATTFIC